MEKNWAKFIDLYINCMYVFLELLLKKKNQCICQVVTDLLIRPCSVKLIIRFVLIQKTPIKY